MNENPKSRSLEPVLRSSSFRTEPEILVPSSLAQTALGSQVLDVVFTLRRRSGLERMDGGGSEVVRKGGSRF